MRARPVGKYLNGFTSSSPTPLGWDVFQPFQGPTEYYGYKLGGTSYGSATRDYSTDVIARRSVRVIENSGEDPLFLFVAPFGPHAPYTPARRHVRAPVSDLVHERDFIGVNERVGDKPRWVRRLPDKDPARQRQVARLQHRAMMSIDDLVADVLDALRSQAKLANSLIIYASDNGQLWGEHQYTGKSVPYRRATEVPLYMRWDNHIAPNSVRGRLALNVDLAATIAAATGVEMSWSEGRSLRSSEQRVGFVIEATPQNPPNPWRPAYCGWRTLDRMYVRYSTGEEELYLYKRDPFELTNVAGQSQHRETLKALRSRARNACVPVPPGFTWTP
jgi:N-acetylglucosamine-6-sulfatase